MRAHYIKKGVLKKTSGQYLLGGCIPMHCYVSNSINNTSLFNIAENGTKVIIVAELSRTCTWNGQCT